MRLFLLILLLAALTACGGGGGGSSSATPEATPDPEDPGAEPTQLAIVDATPASDINADPHLQQIQFAHLGQSDLSVNLESDCENFSGVTLRRQLFDLSGSEFDQLLDHKVNCNLAENSTINITANGTRANSAEFIAEHSVSTTTETPWELTYNQALLIPREVVDDLFSGYVSGALLDELELPGAIEALLLSTILQISEANWENLVDPEALYDVRSERVTYLTTAPDGTPNTALTGLVAFPANLETGTDFIPRDKLIVLMHATGSTPSDQDPDDAWFILANQFASRGYLVIAADNFGRGGTDEFPETYLMANRTARNSADLINAVVSSGNYDQIYNGTRATIIGYSQGGHSAMALYQHLVSHNQDLVIQEVYSGGAPHDLYQTFRGVLEYLNGSCNGNDYCRYVDDETTVPFATDRILPGLTTYTQSGFELSGLTDGETLNDALVSGFLNDDPDYDALKVILQLNSFSNLVSAAEVFGSSDALVHLYHSEFDRLVPHANTQSLATVLQDVVNLDFHENRCNSNGYETIFNLTDKVGVLHTLCGLSVLDDALEDLK